MTTPLPEVDLAAARSDARLAGASTIDAPPVKQVQSMQALLRCPKLVLVMADEIETLRASAASAEARGIERAAKYHDGLATALDHRDGELEAVLAHHHRQDAAAIRALLPAAPTGGKNDG